MNKSKSGPTLGQLVALKLAIRGERLRALFPSEHPSSLRACVRRGWLHSPGAILAKREVRGGLYMGTAVYQATPAGRAVVEGTPEVILSIATRMMAHHIADLDDAVVFHQRRAVALVDGGSDDAV